MRNKKIAILFAAALLVRLAYVLCFPLQTAVGDAQDYDRIAVNLLSGAGFSVEPGIPTPIRGPGFPVLLAAAYFVFGHSLLLVTIVQALLGALACLVTYDIARRLFPEKTALLAAWFTALFPVSVVYTGLLVSETLFTLLFLLSIAAFIRSEGGVRASWLTAAGAALGLATLTRPTTILFPVGIALALLISGSGRPFRKILFFTLAWAAVIAPWTARNYIQFGVFLPVSTGGAMCIYPTGVEAEGGTYGQGALEIAEKWKAFQASEEFSKGLNPYIRFDRSLKAEAAGKIKSHPREYAAVVLKRMPKYWFSSHSSLFGVDRPLGEYKARGHWLPIVFRIGLIIFHTAICLLAGLGMFYSHRTFRAWSVLLLIFLYFNMHALFDLCPRYFIPIFPYLFIFCAAALCRLKDGPGEAHP